MNAIPLDKSLSLFVDQDKLLTIGDVTDARFSDRFKPVKEGQKSYGMTGAAYWIRFTVKNPLHRQVSWIIEQGFPKIKSVELYFSSGDGEYVKKASGIDFLSKSGNVRSRTIVFQLSEDPVAEKTYYLRFESLGSMIIDLSVSSIGEYESNWMNKEKYYWIFYGILIAMILYHLFLYVSLQEWDYLYFILLIFSAFLTFLAVDSTAFVCMEEKMGRWFIYNQPFLLSITNLFVILFTKGYLAIRKEDGFISKMSFFLFVSTSLLIPVAFFLDYNSAARIVYIYTFINLLSQIYFAAQKTIANSRSAKFYLVSFGFCFLGIMLRMFLGFGYFPLNNFTLFSGHAGVVLAITFLSIPLGDKIKKYQQEAIQSLEFAVENMRELSAVKEKFVESLEEKVKEKTAQLSESESRYRALIDLSPDSIAVISSMRFAFLNPAGAKMLGADKPEDLIGRPVIEVIHPRFRNIAKKQFQIFSQSDDKFVLSENRLHLKDGTLLHVEINAMRILFQNKPALLISARDVSQRIHNETELKKMSLAVEHNPASIVITDRKGNIEYVNQKFEEATGFKKHEVIGKKSNILKSNKHPVSFYENLWKTIRSENIWKGRICNKKKNGDFYWESVSISPVIIKNTIAYFVAIKEDITELIRLENLKDDTERIMRHDLKNSLAGIIGISDLLLEDKERELKQEELLSMINKNAWNLSSMINNHMKFYKIEEGKYRLDSQVFNLISILKEIDVAFASNLQMKKLEIKYYLNAEKMNFDHSLLIDGEAILIKTMLENLLLNSLEASPEESEISVELSTENENISISIQNLGVIPEEIRQNFFDKYTTSGKKQGTGLGTYSAMLIARAHGGDITFTSSEESGTRLTITLPAVSEK